MRKGGFIFAGLLGATLIVATACGDGATSTPTFRPLPTGTVVSPTTAPATATSGVAATPTRAAATPAARVLEITTVGEEFKFSQARLTGKGGAPVTLRFRNMSNSQQHNWVLVRAGTKDAVAAAGLTAGQDKGWILQGNPNVIANTELLDPGGTGEATFTVAAGTYQFVCTFPGHNAGGMSGEFVVTP